MLKENESTLRKQDEHDAKENEHPSKPNAYRVEDDSNLEEKDLKTHYLFGEGKMKSTTAPGMEGQGMGGQSFGENNLTPAGNDKDNLPQNADEHNAYFSRTQPAEEHPEDSNFKADADQPNIPQPNELPDQQKIGKDVNNKTPKAQEEYREGTVDDDGYSSSGKWHVET